MKVVDLTGNRYGKLVVLKMNTRKRDAMGKLEEITYHCICDCGNECDIAARVLRTDKRKTCGCGMGIKELFEQAKTKPRFSKGNYPKCKYPSDDCVYSLRGNCCHSCSLYDSCLERCKNDPKRCCT